MEFCGHAGLPHQQDFSRSGNFSDGEQREPGKAGRDFHCFFLRHGEKQLVIVAAVEGQQQGFVRLHAVGRRTLCAARCAAGISCVLQIYYRKFSSIETRADSAGGAEAR